MEKISSYNYVNQIHIFSIVGLITSALFGLGIVFAVPCLVFSYNIKKNYLHYNVDKVDKSIIYGIASIVLSLVCISLELSLLNL